MPRERIAMSPAEVATFLAGKRVAVVGTRAPDGGPDAEAVALAYSDGVPSFVVARGGPTHRNLLADPRVVCSTEEFPSYAEIRGVAVHGRAVLAAEEGEHVVFRLQDARVESFDFGRMRRPPRGDAE
jgi:hypothetical protein